MTVARRMMRGRRRGSGEVDAEHMAWFISDTREFGGRWPWGAGLIPELEAALVREWEGVRDALLDEWIVNHPGRRPRAWWFWNAPEPARQRVGGIGTCDRDLRPFKAGRFDAYTLRRNKRLGPQPDYHGLHCGLPVFWHNEQRAASWAVEGAVAVDTEHPPLFEAQATFLERLALLMSAEARRLRPADFRAEAIVVDDDGRLVYPPP